MNDNIIIDMNSNIVGYVYDIKVYLKKRLNEMIDDGDTNGIESFIDGLNAIKDLDDDQLIRLGDDEMSGTYVLKLNDRY